MFGRKTKPATSNVSSCSLNLYCGLVQRLHQISEMFVVESYFALKRKVEVKSVLLERLHFLWDILQYIIGIVEFKCSK